MVISTTLIMFGTGNRAKVPSRVAYIDGNTVYWGFEIPPGMDTCTWTKLQLDSGIGPTEFDDEVLEAAAALGIFNLPTGKTPVDVVSDYLRHV